jgi:long-chain acyl-CoA synthetase
VNPNGSLKIIDRAKNIFKLSQGEYIAPDKLENIYTNSQWIMAAWVHGDSFQSFVILFAVIQPEAIAGFMKAMEAKGKKYADKQALIDEPFFKAMVYGSVVE